MVIDIGIHCGFIIPKDWPWHAGEQWTPELALEFLSARSAFDDAFNRSDINRYLGRPGQASSYKLGERVWLDLREAARKKHGTNFDCANGMPLYLIWEISVWISYRRNSRAFRNLGLGHHDHRCADTCPLKNETRVGRRRT